MLLEEASPVSATLFSAQLDFAGGKNKTDPSPVYQQPPHLFICIFYSGREGKDRCGAGLIFLWVSNSVK